VLDLLKRNKDFRAVDLRKVVTSNMNKMANLDA